MYKYYLLQFNIVDGLHNYKIFDDAVVLDDADLFKNIKNYRKQIIRGYKDGLRDVKDSNITEITKEQHAMLFKLNII